jgi:hypothetical protein
MVGWDPSCWVSLTPSSLAGGSEAELFRLAPLCEGAAYTPHGRGASPDGPVGVNDSLRAPETSENAAQRKFREFIF